MILFLVSIIPALGLVLVSRIGMDALLRVARDETITGREQLQRNVERSTQPLREMAVDRTDDLYRPIKVSVLALLFFLNASIAPAESGQLYLSCYGKARTEFGRNKATYILLPDFSLTVDFDSRVVLVGGLPAAPITVIDDSSIYFWWEHESSAYEHGPRCGCGEGHSAESCWYEPLHDAQGHLINREPACSVRNNQTFGFISRITGATKVTIVKWGEEETSDFETFMELTCRPRAPESSAP